MVKKMLLLLGITVSIGAHDRERYPDGRPVYDNDGHLIIWFYDDMIRWQLSKGTKDNSTPYDFKQNSKQ